MTKIIDGHVHLYPEKLMTAIMEWFEKTEGWTMPFKGTAAEHIGYLKNIGVDELMVLGYVHKAQMSRDINRWLADLSKKHAGIYPYASVFQDDLNKEEMVQEFLDQENFFGVKIHCFVQRVSAVDQRFEGVMKLLANRGKGLILHASSMPKDTPYIVPDHVEKLLREYPGMKIMVAHLGLPEYHKEYLKMMDKYPGLFLDTAYIFGNPRFNVDFLRDSLVNYGNRIIYGSDFPVMDYGPERAIDHIRSFNLGSKTEQLIFYDNARKFMGK